MSLDAIIRPEILNDDFSRVIYQIAATQPLKHILEIGSSSGQGSTAAWVQGISVNPNKPQLHCIELSKPRFNILSQHYANNLQVNCYWASTVGLSDFPSQEEVSQFYRTVSSKLRTWPLEMVLGWLRADMKYLQEQEAPEDGIKQALKATGQNSFDAVLIDGSEFTGVAEFAQIYGARFILLDDILTYKNWEVFHYLGHDKTYQLVFSRDDIRNGFAVFARTS
jgi:hypothetical protein